MIPPAAIAAAVVAAVGFGAGWTLNGWRLDGKLARCEQHAGELQTAYEILAADVTRQSASVADLGRKGAQAREAGRQAAIAAAAQELAHRDELAALQARLAAPAAGKTCADAWREIRGAAAGGGR